MSLQAFLGLGQDVGVLGLAVVNPLELGDVAGKRREVGRDPLVDGAPLELALDLLVVIGAREVQRSVRGL